MKTDRSKGKFKVILNSNWPIALLCYFTFIYHLWVATHILGPQPATQDEYNYLYQSSIFALNQKTFTPQTYHPQLLEMYVQEVNGKLFSKYPPGFAMLLSIGTRFGLEEIINPLLSTLSVFLLFALFQTFGSKSTSLIVASLFASSPYFTGYSASYFAQMPALFFSLLALYLARRFELSEQKKFLSLLGITIGACYWIRPLDAFILSLSIAILQVFKQKSFRAILAISHWSIIATIFIIGLMLYNQSITGRFSVSTYSIVDSEFQISPNKDLGIKDNLILAIEAAGNRIITEGRILWNDFFFKYTGVVIPIIAILGIFLPSKIAHWKWACILMIGLNVLLYSFHKAGYSRLPGWPIYGSRYWFSAFPCWLILAGSTLSYLNFITKNKLYSILILLVALGFHLFYGSNYLKLYKERLKARESIRNAIENHCPGKRIVQLDLKNKMKVALPRFVNLRDFHRNPFIQGEKLFVIGKAKLGLLNLFPEYTPCDFGLELVNFQSSN